MIKEMPVPMEAFHLTKSEWVSQILSQGLVPGVNRNARFEDEDGDRVGIYVTSDWEAILGIDESFSEDEYVLLKVNLRGIRDRFVPDRAYEMDFDFTEEDIAEGLCDLSTWFTRSKVSSKRIEVVGTVRRKGFEKWELVK